MVALGCAEYNTVSVLRDPRRYYVCLDGRYEAVACKPGYIFDAQEGFCIVEEDDSGSLSDA